ncbi:transcriptional protein SWT1 [Kryptolebias marmoratus]|uniref:Transcriptional protein SWT1 n=1 Tax=Kryptolebias marmoratus TaxID=37003 RepID=A0A3Q3AYY5_KRYMA|nr:transcriptional protein SWT1 [Kryptolebias marmoratus]
MSQNPKKRKRRKSPFSSEDEKKVSKLEDDSRRKKRCIEDVKSHTRKAKQQKTSVKEDLTRSRHNKKPIFKSKQQAGEQKAVTKERGRGSTSTVSVHLHEKSCSSKEEKHNSSRYKNTSKHMTGEKDHSRPSSTRDTASASQATNMLKDRTDKKYSLGTSSKLEKLQVSPSPSTVLQKDQKQKGQRRNGSAEEPSRTQHDNGTRKTTRTDFSSCKDSPKQRSRGEIKNSCKSYQAKDLLAKWSLCTDAKDLSASDRNRSSSPAKHRSSEISSQLWKKVPLTCESDTPVPPKPAPSSAQKQMLNQKFVPFKFRIPKTRLPRPAQSTDGNYNNVTTNKNPEKTYKNKLPKTEVLKKEPDLETVQPCNSLKASFNSSYEQQDKRSPSPAQLLPVGDTNIQQCYDQGQVVKELHLARSEKRLEVNVMESYGDLTCMDIDSPEERPAQTFCRQTRQQDLILVLDTNILLSHLDYVKGIKSCGLGAMGFPVVLIPWVVLQELDSLKRGRGQIGSVAHLATPAISYIYTSLKSWDPHLWGQSMQQAAVSSNGLNAENNDDRVLQCCLQYQNMYPGCALILCTNDKNLCSKALLSGVRAFCKSDLEAEVQKSRHSHSILQNIQAPALPQISPEVSSPVLATSCTTVQSRGQEKAGLSVVAPDKDNKRLSEGDNEKTKRELSRRLFELEECLREVLSDVLEVEMKAAFEDLWLEIVYIKPPWTLRDLLQCFKKHWIAVFGHIVPRKILEIISNLITFFNSGEAVQSCATAEALQEAKELVKAFWKSSKHVPQAITVLENIYNKLQSQHNVSVEEESLTCDVIMKDDDEDKLLVSAQVSPQEVWSVFENIWTNAFQTSVEVFKALGFNPQTLQTTTPMGGPAPPQDAVACLHKLSSMASQLLQAFSSVLSSAPGLEEVQMLLAVIYSNKIVNEDSRLTAKHLFDCFSQPEYREKLQVGGNQLMELKKTLDCCIQATGQHASFTT